MGLKMTISSENENTYLNKLNSKNIQYADPLEDNDEFQFLENCYYGTGGFKNNYYIYPHVREPKIRYDRRRSQAYYLNMFAPLVNANTLPLFKKEPKRSYTENPQEKEIIDGFMMDCDLKGHSLNAFMKNALRWAHIDGVAYVMVENFKEIPVDIKGVIEERSYPYLTLIRSKNLKKFTLDDYSNLESFTYYYGVDEEGENIYIKITNEYYVRVDKDGEEIDERTENVIGYIPIVPINVVDDYQFKPLSRFYQIGRMNYRLYNLISEQQEQESNSMYPIITKPSDGSPNKVEAGTTTGLEYDSESNKPEYLSPPVDPIKVLQDSEAKLIDKMFVSANMTFMTDSSNVSAEAKKWAFERTDTALSEFALVMEDAEAKIFKIIELFVGFDPDVKIQYNRIFGIIDVEKILSETMEIISINEIGNKGRSEIVKNFLNEYYSYSDQEFVDELKNSVDDELLNINNVNNDPIE